MEMKPNINNSSPTSMNLPDEAIQEFQDICFKRYGKRLGKSKAQEIAQKFFTSFAASYQPIQAIKEVISNGKK